ncbi:MAG: N-acetyl-gamma-glutamyl-phosphate reductase [Planctomycetaceae bacterium]|nr:N-acetyl-gamma-glutamyl-phosphate reductase [Planctomycetaceae bacterium]
MHHPLRTVIVGAAGYTGAELASLLAAHPACEIVGVFGSEKRAAEGEQPLSRLFPRLRGVVDLPLRVASVQAIVDLKPNVVFLCTPHEVSAAMSEALLAAELVVIDLSAAFRLHNAADYPTHYGFEHPAAHLLQRAVYGLPEFNRARIAESDLIACAVKSLFCEVSFQPYNALKHRHQPEMRQETGCTVLFTPHLLPLDRGIVSTIHAELADGVTEAQVRAWLQRIYEGESFVRLLPAGEWPSVGGVERTNFCDIGLAVDEATRHLLLVSSIDNLVKGASGQAVQCMNVRFGLPETMGLLAEFSEQMQ